MSTPKSKVDRDALVGHVVSLDGRPALILGRKLDFATVCDGDGRAFQWSWESAERIAAAGGEFRS